MEVRKKERWMDGYVEGTRMEGRRDSSMEGKKDRY